MSEAKDMTVRDLLAAATQQRPEDRSAFLDEACRGDQQLREEVQSLLSAFEEDDDFLGVPAMQHPALVPEGAKEGPGTRIGRYELMDLIGEGGFGSVFRARQEHPVRRDVALKIVKPGMDTRRVIARFNAERQALAMMDHPHIAKVLEAGATDAGRPYFVMELVEGVPFTRYCDEHKLSIRQRLGLFIQVCQAVQHAHTKGIIHRDLKPSNILVTAANGAAAPKVIDFGIAKATQGRLTEQSFTTDQQHWLGTPQYMSPEQADGGVDIDTRTDIYSLGVILYELLCGCAPFDFKTSGYSKIQQIIRQIDPPPPSTRSAQRELRGDLDRIVLKAMEKDRSRRYETASAFAADIQRYLKNEPVTARHAGRLYRFGKLVRRNRLAFGSAAALLATLLGGLWASTWSMLRAVKAEGEQGRLRWNAEHLAYASDMNLIQQALSVNNLGRARELLDRYRPKPGETDQRGWEWRYLWQQCRSEALMELHPKPSIAAQVTSLAVSPDGRLLAVGQADGGLSVWDLPARRQIPAPPAGDNDVRVAFSPRGPLLAFSCSSTAPLWRHELHLWDPNTGKELATRTLDHECVGLAFDQDGQTLVTSTWGPEGQVTLWQVPRLTVSRRFNAPQSSNRQLLGSPFAIRPDLSAAAVAPDGVLTFVNLSTEQLNRRDDTRAATVAFSPDGRILAVSSGSRMGAADSVIRLLDANTGKPLGPPLEGHLAWVGALVFWPDSRILASAGADRTIRLWDTSDPAHPRPIGRPLRGHTHEVWRLALLPDGKTLVSGAKDGSVCLWDISASRDDRSHQTIHLWPGRGTAWDFCRGGAALIIVDPHGHVERREGRELQDRRTIMDLGDKLYGAVVTDQGRCLTWQLNDGTIRAWDLEAMRELRSHPRGAKAGAHYDFTPERYVLLHFVSDKTPPELDPMNPLTVASWHPVGFGDNTAVEWDLVNGREVATWHPAGVGAEYAMAKGSWRVTIDRAGVGTLMDRATGRQTNFDLQTREVEDACFSPNGSLLALASSRFGTVELWNAADLTTGDKLPSRASLTGFTLAPHSVTFSPDGTRLAAGSDASEAVKLFDVDSRQEVLTLAATGSSFDKIRFSPDGNVLAASNRDDELHLWRAPTLAETDAAEANRAGR